MAGEPRSLSLSSDGLRITHSALKAICACTTSARHFLKASAPTNLDTLKAFSCVLLRLENVRGCYAGVCRLMHELIDSIHSWDAESDEHAMVDMLASFPKERFEVGSTTLLLQPLCPSHSTFSSCPCLCRAHAVLAVTGGRHPNKLKGAPKSVVYLAAVPIRMTHPWRRPKWRPMACGWMQ